MAARVLILEPAPDVRDLLARLVTRLGHEPVESVEGQVPDVVIVEPADADARSSALALKRDAPLVPIVCASILPRHEASADLAPAAYLEKPFQMADLARALSAALPTT